MAAQRRAMREAEEELKRKMAANGGKRGDLESLWHSRNLSSISHILARLREAKKRCVKSGAVAQTHTSPSCATDGGGDDGSVAYPREITNGVKVQGETHVGRERCIYLLSHTSVLVASSANPVIQ